MKRSAEIILTAAILCATGTKARAAFIFDNSAAASLDTTRHPSDSPGTFIKQVAIDTPITNISVLNFLNTAGDMKFLIFDHATGLLLLQTDPLAFAADAGSADTPKTWKRSPDFVFTLLAGHQYDIGGIADVAAHYAYIGPSNPDYTQNGITSGQPNANFTSFDAPAEQRVRGDTDIALRLESTPPAPVVPEPPSFALFGLGALIVVGCAYRRHTLRA
jgi:PEP-CTERM motif